MLTAEQMVVGRATKINKVRGSSGCKEERWFYFLNTFRNGIVPCENRWTLVRNIHEHHDINRQHGELTKVSQVDV